MVRPSTELEALIAAMLGDVGRLNQSVDQLNERLGPQLADLHKLFDDAQEAALAASSSSAGNLGDVLDQQVAESMRLLQATADVTKQQVAVLRKIDPRLGRRWVLPAAVAAAIMVSVGTSSSLVWWVAGKRDQDAIVRAAVDPEYCVRLGGQPGVAEQRSYCVFFAPPMAATGGQQP